MSMTVCKECGKEISTQASICPNCGAPQFQSRFPDGLEKTTHKEPMSTKKILSIVALALSILGVFRGGLGVEIAALVSSIVALSVHGKFEKDAKAFALIALIISIIMILLYVLYLFAAGNALMKLYDNLGDL